MRGNRTALRALLDTNGYTCALDLDGRLYGSTARGVAPLLGLLESGEDFRGALAADRVVGKAAAFLYVLLGVRSLWAGVLSRPALEVLERYDIPVEYGSLVPAIRNRAGTGFCPMETAVLDLNDASDAPAVLRSTLKHLHQNDGLDA